jgi:type IV pilus assembly protein PilY1
MNTIFSQIQAVNSVFASVSLPLSINSQGTYLNQIYVGMFRPDLNGLPRWSGNLKQYRLGVVNNRLVTVDADGAEAINSLTGFIAECARSYWTTADNYWAFSPQGACIGASTASNSPDGNVTEKGAQAQRLRSTTTRNVKTCTAFSCAGGLSNFNATNLTGANAGANISADSTQRQRLIRYQRGLDVNDEDIDAVTLTEMRPSAHGDVVHSRPVAINYGTNIAPQIVVFYGGNDGVLRAINGNRETAIGTVGAGSELWSFVAPEFFPYISRLHNNNVQISYEGNPTEDPLPQVKPYGLDGSITAYTSGSTRWIYTTARRGGRVVYAFNVSNLNTDTGSPELLWKIGCPTNLPDSGDTPYPVGGYPDTIDDGCTSGFDDLGQTWSVPKPLETLGYTASGLPAPMLIMGGGYDTCEDEDPIKDTCRSSSKGSKVYVMNAATGELLNTFDTDRGVAADVFVVPEFIRNSAGEIVQVLAKYAYVVDLGGNIYRISGATANETFGTAHPEDWTITKIASLGCNSNELCTPNRKFMFMPDIVEQPEPGSGTFHLLVGSGDREKPLLTFDSATTVTNYFFMVKDNPTDPDWLVDSCGVSDVICISSLTPITSNADPDPDDLADSKGWYLGLHDDEQVVTSAITVFGTTTFSTHTPLAYEPNSCEGNLGDARVYNVGYLNAVSRNGTQNRWEDVSGDGLPPSPVAGLIILDGTTTPIPFIIGADPDSPLQGGEPTPPSSTTQPKSLTYWYIEQ